MLIPVGNASPYWYLLRTKPRQERLALEHVTARVGRAYCPRTLEPPGHRYAARGPVPLFPGYLFAYCDATSQYLPLVYCPGVRGFVRFGNFLAAVEEDFISFLKSREDSQGLIPMPRPQRSFTAGTRVRITKGVFKGYEGLVESYLPARDRVRLLLGLVTGVRKVELEAAVVSHL